MRTVEYKGKVLETVFDDVSPQEVFDECVKQYYTKPDIEDVKKELRGIIKDKNEKKTLTNKYFLQEVHDKVLVRLAKWTLEDMFTCKDVFDVFYSKTLRNKNVFNDTNTLNNVLTAVRLGGKGILRHATYYPLYSVRYICEKYCKPNGNYYDYSCGWCDRLLGAMASNVNYFGTDPNYELTAKLEEIDKVARQTTYIGTTTKIYTQGSEYFIPELEGKIDLAFSSPPYFDLEDYQIGEQSFKEGTSYEAWLYGYMKGTMENIYKYLKEDGYFAINIKNSDEHALMDDCVRLAQDVGFKFVCWEELENILRVNGSGEVDNAEKIAILSKGAEKPTEQKVVDLW